MDADVLHQSDTLPRRYGLLTDGETGETIDISPSTTILRLRLRERGTDTIMETIVCTKFDPDFGLFYFDWPADVFDPDDFDAGRYEIEAELEVDGDLQTINYHAWADFAIDDSPTYPIKLKEEF